jgi:hydrogenase expression/formation protein HypD
VKHLDEYRDPAAVRNLAAEIRAAATRQWTIMEICGGQTHTIVKYGLEALLPGNVALVHGPGCPVCVTPADMIDRAIDIAAAPGVILASFGDMLRVPGSRRDLLAAKARGGDVRIVYSPLDALSLARQRPDKRIVFFAVGFETTAPACAMAVREARRTGVGNFSILCAHVLVPPAVRTILSSPGNRVQAFLAAGHVCTITGYEEYLPIAGEFGVPIVVTGFEPVDILQGVLWTVRQLERGSHEVENQYARAVLPAGNPAARSLLGEVFEVTDRAWRGIGVLPSSGYRLRDAYAAHDAEKLFPAAAAATPEPNECIAGLVLQGRAKPHECPAFGSRCSPERPLGAPMVSSEGACAAYYRYSTRRISSRTMENIK